MSQQESRGAQHQATRDVTAERSASPSPATPPKTIATTVGTQRLNTIVEHLNSDLQFITAGRAAAEAALRAPGTRWTNHAQLGCCNPAQHHTPRSVEELQQIIRRIRSRHETCRVVGAGKSPSAICFTQQHMIHMEHLSRVLSVNGADMTITCEGGTLLGDLHSVLDNNGLMLKCVPSIVDMTIAGALATAAHSSGISTKSICGYVVEMVFVNGMGELVTFNRTDHLRELRTAACHLGALGVVARVKLQAERKSLWRVTNDCLTVGKLQQVLAQRVMTSEFYRFWWTPHTDYCYETIARRQSPADEEGRGDTQSAAAQSTAVSASTTKSATPLGRVTRALQLMRRQNTAESDFRVWQQEQSSMSARVERVIKGPWLKHHTLEAALLAACYAPMLQPMINRAYQSIFLSSPQVMYGNTVEAFTFDCLFRQWACEWAIEAHRALEAFDLIRQLVLAHRLALHFPVEFRFADEDEVALSPAVGRRTCWVGLVMYRPHGREARDTLKAYTLFCDAMQRLGGRPHWAKHFRWRSNDIAAAYGNHWKRWLELREAMDPQQIFVNPWLKQLMTNE